MERLTSTPKRPLKQRRAFSVMGGPIERGGDPEASAALAGLFRVDAALARALTHGFHSYAGRMHPSMARGAIGRFSAPGARVLDPFCGSGTVLVEAMVAGRAAGGVDASPIAVRIAEVRTDVLDGARRARLVQLANEVAETAAERARKRQRPEIPSWARGELRRFPPHVALELLGLRTLVWETRDDEVGRALRMCFSSILSKFTREPGDEDEAPVKRIARGLPSSFLARRAEELARGLAALERATPAHTPRPEIRAGDARALAHVRDGSVDLVLTSPPYAGVYDYVSLHDVRFTWLGLRQAPAGARQLGAREQGLGASPRAWRDSRRRWLGEIGRVLRPGGHAVLVVGDGVVGNAPEDAADAIAADAPAARLQPFARASQERPTHDRRLRDIFGGRPRREHLLLLRR